MYICYMCILVCPGCYVNAKWPFCHKYAIRESYMGAHVSLSLLNELRKYKCEVFLSILSPFFNKFNNFNNTEVQTLGSFDTRQA